MGICYSIVNVLLGPIANSNNFWIPPTDFRSSFICSLPLSSLKQLHHTFLQKIIITQQVKKFIFRNWNACYNSELLTSRFTIVYTTQLQNVTYTTAFKTLSYSNQCLLLCSQLNSMHIRSTVFTTLSQLTLFLLPNSQHGVIELYCRSDTKELLISIFITM